MSDQSLIQYENKDHQLVTVAQVQAFLATGPSFEAAKDIADKIDAVASYYKKKQECDLETYNGLMESKLRVERYLARLLAAIPKAQGRRTDREEPSASGAESSESRTKGDVLVSIGMTDRDASRLESFIKDVSDDEFEQEIKKAREQATRINKNAMIGSVTSNSSNGTEDKKDSSILDRRFLRCQYCNALYSAGGKFASLKLPYCPKHLADFRSSDAEKFVKLDEDTQIEILDAIDSGYAGNFTKALHNMRTEQRMLSRESYAQSSVVKPTIELGSWDTWLVHQNMCDLLITDPPYSTDIEDIFTFATEWLPVALAKVKPTGRAYICVGAYPDELYAYLSAGRKHMRLAQILVWTYRNTMGPSPKIDYKQNWQAILYFRGDNVADLDCSELNELFSVQDINAPDGRLGDRYHAWQKPDELAERLIRHSTKPGDLILDPFSGTGTFLLAANRLGRIGKGCDIDQLMIDIAIKRGCNNG